MPFNPAIHNRHSIRLPGYDYSQSGAYFLTILTHKREHLLGQVVGGVVKLSPVGEIVQKEWLRIPRHFSNVDLGACVIMPDHMHAIVVIKEDEVVEGKGKAFDNCLMDNGRTLLNNTINLENTKSSKSNALPIRLGSAQPLRLGSQSESTTTPPRLGSVPGSLPAIVQNFKSVTSRKINKLRKTPGSTIWHRNYYEHIIRDAADFERITAYIEQNPQKWEEDKQG